jgi:hypothetical protein
MLNAERKARRALYGWIDAGAGEGPGATAEQVAAAELLGQERLAGFEPAAETVRAIRRAELADAQGELF